MSTFLDGPAKGEALTLTRNPPFLRITQNGPCFRALDGLGDEPEETELIYVYQRNPDRRSYHYFTPQPSDKRIRQTHAWRGWTNEQARLMEKSA